MLFIAAFAVTLSFYAVPSQRKIGLLLVNHGSRSAAWRNSLLQLEKNIRPEVLKDGVIGEVKTAFMEYTEPSIATRLKEFDKEGYDEIIIVPVFLTVSPHSFDDIPTIIGQKDDYHSREMMRIEKIERYKPNAHITIAPLLDFSEVLEKNLLRRVKALSKNPQSEGLVMIAYGDQTYEKEWGALLSKMGDKIKAQLGITDYAYGWCGHVAHYNPQHTTDAIHKITVKGKKALVVPVLVAFDEMFQIKIIGDGVKKAREFKADVVYTPDAILPDKNIEQWVIAVAKSYAQNKVSKK